MFSYVNTKLVVIVLLAVIKSQALILQQELVILSV